MADYPIVPLDKVAAQLNIDMIGRNRCDEPSESNTVYLVGSDRISTELHNLNEDTNKALSTPLKLDYEMQRSGGPGVDLHAQRSLQLCVEGHPDHFLHDRTAQGLPLRDRRGQQDRVPEDGAHHAAGLRDGTQSRQSRSLPRAGQQGTEGGEGVRRGRSSKSGVGSLRSAVAVGSRSRQSQSAVGSRSSTVRISGRRSSGGG